MTLKEQKELVDWAMQLPAERLEAEYYEAVYDTIGGVAETLIDRGMCMADVVESERQRWGLTPRVNTLEQVCRAREIRLWEDV